MANADRVIVVGAGVLGASAAFHLLEAGVSEVCLLDRDDVAQGTSRAGAGFVAEWAAGSVQSFGDYELEQEHYGISMYRDLDRRGHEIRLRANGNLWAISSADSWERHLRPFAEHDSVRHEILDADQARRITGLTSADGVAAAIYQPDGVHVSAPLVTSALVREASARGADVRVRCPASELIVEGGRVVGVRTPSGVVRAGTVVLAAGAWTNGLLHRLGLWLAMVPLMTTRILTDEVGAPGAAPTIMLPEFASMWVREHEGGLCFGCAYETAPRYAFAERDPPERFDELPLDSVFEMQRVGRAAAEMIPALSRYRSIRVAHGAPCYTADNLPIVGPVPGIDGLFAIGGCNEAGITHGPGMGRVLAAGVVGTEANQRWSPARFSDIPDAKALLERLNERRAAIRG